MRYKTILSSLATALAAAVAAASPTPVEHLNLEESLALSGYDAVSYQKGEPVEGLEQWSHTFGGAVYRFANTSNLEQFKAEPERYAPAYGGWCAYAMLDGDKVEVNPMRFKVIEGKTYLFYDGFWGDTLKRWNKKLSKTPETSLVSEADSHWDKILAK